MATTHDKLFLETAPGSKLLRAAHRWAEVGHAGPALEKLRGKIAHNLDLGWGPFFKKGLRFARSAAMTRFLLRGIEYRGVGVRVIGHAPKIEKPGGVIQLGNDVVLASPVTPIFFDLKPTAFLSIGDDTWVNDGVWFGCTELITIGKRVLIGPGVRLFDNNYHELYNRTVTPKARAVTVEDDVWIAADAIISPGVTLGRGAVIATQSVVREDVERRQ